MKCIIYVSKALDDGNDKTIPKGLSTIFRQARKKNKELGVTSVLSYRQGYYIQAIEGEANAVDALFASIINDERHQRVTTILDTQTEQPFFPEWSMKLVESVSRIAEFRSLIEHHPNEVSQLPDNKKKLLRLFFNHKATENEFLGSYQGRNLSLHAWPDFTLIKQSPTIIELCAQLTNQSHSYEDLVNSRKFGTAGQINKILDNFDKQGILVNASTAPEPNKREEQKPESAGFYAKMRNFLGLSVKNEL